MPETYFAPAGRRDPKVLEWEVNTATQNPVIDAVMQSVGGLLAVLNEQRQILAVNDALLQMLGIRDISEIVGLRPGEAIDCIHCDEGPDGCGTTRYCSTCGAAIAILTSLESNAPQERDCSAAVHRGDDIVDLTFRIRSHPIVDDGRRFLLLFLQDTTSMQRRAALERVFFHDINNLLYGLQGVSDLLDCKDPQNTSELLATLRHLVSRLTREMKIQQTLSAKGTGGYTAHFQEVALDEIFADLKTAAENHPAAAGKTVEMSTDSRYDSIHTDRSLLTRVLTNMLINALEAGEAGETVRLEAVIENQVIRFSVWNRQRIPDPVTLRIFQRNFTTKSEAGRGLGTYSMKLFGEKALGGKIDFETGTAGTTFSLELPV